MNFSKSIRIVTVVILSFSMLALTFGCTVGNAKYAGQTLTVKVTSFDGETVIAETGELSETTGDGNTNDMTMPQNSAPNAPGMPTGSVPAMPSGDSMPQNSAPNAPGMPTGSAPIMPSGFEIPNGASIPQNAGDPTVGASGNWPNGDNFFMPGMKNGSVAVFTSSGETVTFSLADNTAIISESNGSAVFTSASEITIGSVLQVLFDSNGKSSAVIVKSVVESAG